MHGRAHENVPPLLWTAPSHFYFTVFRVLAARRSLVRISQTFTFIFIAISLLHYCVARLAPPSPLVAGGCGFDGSVVGNRATSFSDFPAAVAGFYRTSESLGSASSHFRSYAVYTAMSFQFHQFQLFNSCWSHSLSISL